MQASESNMELAIKKKIFMLEAIQRAKIWNFYLWAKFSKKSAIDEIENSGEALLEVFRNVGEAPSQEKLLSILAS